MRTLLWLLLVADQLLLLFAGSIKLDRFELSEFAFRQQFVHRTDPDARLHKQLYRRLPEVKLLRSTIIFIAAVASATIFSHLTQPVLGLIYALFLLVAGKLLTRLEISTKLAHKIFEDGLAYVLSVTQFLQPLWLLLGTTPRREGLQLGSEAELNDLLRRLPSTVLNSERRQHLEAVIDSQEKTIKDIMTPRKRVIMVEAGATLGPILLSDLQKSGHGYFPVVVKNARPEGILMLSELNDIHQAKQRKLVRDFMSSHIVWVNEADSLVELTQVILHEKQYMLMVQNNEQEFIGVVTISDVIKHLVGIVKA